MRYLTGLTIVLTMFFGSWFGALVYDPVTNRYVSDTDTGAQASSITTTWTSTTWTNTTSSSTGITSVTTISVTSSSFSVPSPSSYQGPLAAMHIQLDQHLVAVMDKLQEHLDNLNEANTDTLQQAADRLRILTCLGVVQSPTNIYDLLGASASNLGRSIEIVSTDVHSNISALEEKINKRLLDDLVQQLEILSIQNKVDAFFSEYSNVVDLFFEVSIGKVQQVEKLFTSLSADAKKQVELYDESSQAYFSLMSAYDDFLTQSSFAGVVAWPNLHDMINLTNWFKVYQRSLLLNKRQTDIAAMVPPAGKARLTEKKKQLLQDFSLLFNEKTQGLLGNLYPIDELLLLNKQVMSLRGAYMDEKTGSFDCKAFVSNPTISITWPELEKYMTQLLTKLNIAVSKVATGDVVPSTKEALLAGVRKGMDEQIGVLSKDLLAKYKADLSSILQDQWEDFLSLSAITITQKLEVSVRGFLQKKYLIALDAGTINDFQVQLIAITKKINDKLGIDSLSTVQRKILSIIESIVQEFLG